MTHGLECLTIIDGNCYCDGVDCTRGMTIVLFPNESIDNAELIFAFVARYRGE